MTSQSQPRQRKTSILTRWPTVDNPSTIYQPAGQPFYPQQQPSLPLQQQHWLPPVDYDDDEEEESTTPSGDGQQQQQQVHQLTAGGGPQGVDPDDRSLEFQQQQALSFEERQLRRKISMSNITGKVKMPSRRRSVIEFYAEMQSHELQSTASGGRQPQNF